MPRVSRWLPRSHDGSSIANDCCERGASTQSKGYIYSLRATCAHLIRFFTKPKYIRTCGPHQHSVISCRQHLDRHTETTRTAPYAAEEAASHRSSTDQGSSSSALQRCPLGSLDPTHMYVPSCACPPPMGPRVLRNTHWQAPHTPRSCTRDHWRQS